MALAADSMGFGHGRFGKGPFGHGPWVTFQQTPGFTVGQDLAFAVDVTRFDNLAEQRYLLASDPGIAMTWEFGTVDSVTVIAVQSWYAAAGGPATRFTALDHRGGVPRVVRFEAEDFQTNRLPIMARRLPPFTLKAVRYATLADHLWQDQPMGWWRLDETAGVSTATNALFVGTTGNHGQVRVGVTFGASGALTGEDNTAATFNGTSGTILVGSLGNGTTSFAQITLECWFRRTAVASRNTQFLVYLPAAGGAHGLILTTSYLLRTQGAGGTVTTASLSTAILDTSWHHVAWTHAIAGGTNRDHLFLDGDDVSAASTLRHMGAVTSGSIGAAFGLGGNNAVFEGALDEVAVYSGELGANHVRMHYLLGTRR